MKRCRECQEEITNNPKVCPNCGAPRPTKEKWKDWGFEYKSKTTVLGIPLLHISFKYRPNWIPVPAKGIISIGQFGIGIINISQFGIGIISLSQFTIAFYALAQIAIAYSLIAYLGLYIDYGYGQYVWSMDEFFDKCKSYPASQYTYQPPEYVNDGFIIGSLDDVNIDSTVIEKAVNEIRCGKFNEVHSMLLLKDNKLVLEEYFDGHTYKWDAYKYHGEFLQWDRNKMHHIMSCTKSFTSAFIGIAIDNGYIDNVHQSIFDYLPEHQHLKTNGKEHITIEHLLTMTSGLEWDEWSAEHGTSANDIDRIYLECSADPVKCVIEKELTNTPGEAFTYNGGGMIILGEILRNATKVNIDEFSLKYLFGKLGIDSTIWYRFENGAFATDGSLYLKPRDMLKFGVTYLNRGFWNGERILPEDWIVRSSEIYNDNEGINIPGQDSGENGYGYSWWISEFSYKANRIKMFRAGGWGGQSIMVFPDLDMVVVFTGGNYAARSLLFKIIKRYVLPSIK